MQQYLNLIFWWSPNLLFTIYFPLLPGWRKSKRRKSSSGKKQSVRSPSAWLHWVPLQSPPTCWRRRRMRTCCLSDAHLRHTSTYLFCASQAMSVSSHASDGSCFFVYLSVMVCIIVFWCWKVLVCVSRFVTVQNPECHRTWLFPNKGVKIIRNNLKRV